MSKIDRPSREIVQEFLKFDTGMISDTFDELGMEGVMLNIFPIVQGVKIAGPAVTVKERPVIPTPEKLRLVEAINTCEPGDIIVIDADGTNCGTWGGLVSRRAMAKGVAGVIVDGTARDIIEIRTLKFPVWARSFSPLSAVKRLATLSINVPVQCCGVYVNPGDIILADDDGAVVIPKEKVNEVLVVARRMLSWEERVVAELEKGVSEALKKRLE